MNNGFASNGKPSFGFPLNTSQKRVPQEGHTIRSTSDWLLRQAKHELLVFLLGGEGGWTVPVAQSVGSCYEGEDAQTVKWYSTHVQREATDTVCERISTGGLKAVLQYIKLYKYFFFLRIFLHDGLVNQYSSFTLTIDQLPP